MRIVRMLGAVALDDQPVFERDEIDDERTERDLAAPFHRRETPAAQHMPKRPFRLRRRLAHRAGVRLGGWGNGITRRSERTPHPALRATFSRKGRRDSWAAFGEDCSRRRCVSGVTPHCPGGSLRHSATCLRSTGDVMTGLSTDRMRRPSAPTRRWTATLQCHAGRMQQGAGESWNQVSTCATRRPLGRARPGDRRSRSRTPLLRSRTSPCRARARHSPLPSWAIVAVATASSRASSAFGAAIGVQAKFPSRKNTSPPSFPSTLASAALSP